MSDDLIFETATRRKDVIQFTLDGELYDFTPPKAAKFLYDSMEVGETKALFAWLDAGLPEEQADRIEERLRNPDDDLDVASLIEVINKLAERASGRPTMSPSASGGRRGRTGKR